MRKSYFIFVTTFILGVLFLVTFSASSQEPGDNDTSQGKHFLIKSENHPLAKILSRRHTVNGGFTTDLSEKEAFFLNALGVSLEELPQYHILETGKGKGNGGNSNATITPSRVASPSDQTPWGIEKIYKNTTIASTIGGIGIDVAVLDTGVNRNHIDLFRRIGECKDFSSNKSPLINDKCVDRNGHGTHVAGTVLADGGSDGLGIYGIAPEAKLFAYKVCSDNGFCWSDDIAYAIRKAADNGAEIISMSLGSNAESSLIRDAIDYATAKGVLIVAAAGNDGPAIGSIDYPGANAKVIAVAAIDSSETIAPWSSRGINDGDYIIETREVEFGAPGVAVESTWKDGGYQVISGTSMATPHISGLAAKLWQGTADATRTYLQNLAKLHDLDVLGDDPASGFGLPQVQ